MTPSRWESWPDIGDSGSVSFPFLPPLHFPQFTLFALQGFVLFFLRCGLARADWRNGAGVSIRKYMQPTSRILSRSRAESYWKSESRCHLQNVSHSDWNKNANKRITPVMQA
jgi:hypothetical protein